MKLRHNLVLVLSTLAIYQSAIATNTTNTSSYVNTTELSQRWAQLRQEQPKLQVRDAAQKLGVSEAELVATQAVRLQSGSNAARAILRRALDLGEVMALTRNEHGVIETTGVAKRYPVKAITPEMSDEEKRRIQNSIGGYISGPIDLRFHFDKWEHAFAQTLNKDGKTTRSLQFFDASGTALHKIYVKSDTGNAVFDRLVEEFRHPQAQAPLNIIPSSKKVAAKADTEIDIKEFQLAWKEMSDVHQFNRLLTEFKLDREQALRLAPSGMARSLSPVALRTLLNEAAQKQVGIMAFLGNTGLTQIFSGTITKVAASGDWFNVLDPKFNLHIRENALSRAWLIQRAGITSVEFYDKEGQLVLSFFAVRENGKPQPQTWLDLVSNLPASSS
jgi:putative hemin transport protein